MFLSDDHATGVRMYTHNMASTYFSSLILYSSLPSTPVCISVSFTYIQVSCTCVNTHTHVHKHTQMYKNKIFPKHTSQLLCLLLCPQVPCLPITILHTFQELIYSVIAFAYLLHLPHPWILPNAHHKNPETRPALDLHCFCSVMSLRSS